MNAVLSLASERLKEGAVVKICGLREPEHAIAAAEAGADLLGFIFAPARRRVTPEQARRCIEAARRATSPARGLLAVGVFVDASPVEIGATVREAGLDVVQLHGAEPPGFPAMLPVPTIKALKPLPPAAVAETIEVAAAYFSATQRPVALLIDGYHPTSAGGSGTRADWGLARAVSPRWPTLLAGGLTPENVAEAIQMVRPLGVDVSGGVEEDGIKDSERIAAFIVAAKAAFVQEAARSSAA